MKMVRIVIALTPYGVMALMTTVFSSYHFQTIRQLTWFYRRLLYRDFHDVYRACHLASSAVIIQRVISEWSGRLNLCVCFPQQRSALYPAEIAFRRKNLAYKAPLPIFHASFETGMGQNGCAEFIRLLW